MGATDLQPGRYHPIRKKPNIYQKSRIDHGQHKKMVFGIPEPVSASSTDEDDEEEVVQFEDGDWRILILTEKAVRNGHVVMVIYGNKENSTRVILNPRGEDHIFQAGFQDEFKINLKGFGKISKIRLELIPSSSNVNPKWKVREVKLQNLMTQELLKFKFNCQLSKSKGKKGLMVELPAVRPGQKVLPVLQYYVEVHTAHEPGADTDANVYLNIFGGLGDSGKRMLLHSDKPQRFQEGQVDIFHVEAVSLGSIKRCLLSCDGTGPGEGWKCAKIIVKEHEDAPKEYCFPCHQWMEKSVGDGRLQRLLKAKRQKQDKDDGRNSFFHQLVGNQPQAVLVIPSDDEDSDPGFYRRHRVNISRIQTAIHLKRTEVDLPSIKPTGQDQLKLPRIDSPSDPADRHHSKYSKGGVKLPDIHQSSQLHRKPNTKSLEKEKALKEKSRSKKREDALDLDLDEPKYPWDSSKNRDIRNEALHEKKLRGIEKAEAQVNLTRFQRRTEDVDAESFADVDDDVDDGADLSDRRKTFKHKRSRTFERKQDAELGNTETDERVEPIASTYRKEPNERHPLPGENGDQFDDPVPRSHRDDSQNDHHKSDSVTSNSNINQSKNISRKHVSKSPNGSTNTITSRRSVAKYNPRTKKGDFPWEEEGSRNRDKPKTALVRPTKRVDLNPRFWLKKKKTFVKKDTKKKYENIDSHFPSRVELRLMARRAKLQKERPPTVKPRKLHPVVSKKFYVGVGSIDERIRKRRERQAKDKQSDVTYKTGIRRVDNITLNSMRGPHYGSVRTEIRSMKKKYKAKQKEEERLRREEREKREKKAKVPVFMPPIEKEKKEVTYGENYHNKKSAINSSHTTKPNTAAKVGTGGGKKSSPTPIGKEDDAIWDYFASVVDNLKSIEARQRIEEEEAYGKPGFDDRELPPDIVRTY